MAGAAVMIEERIRRKIEELIDRAELSLVHDTSDRLRDNNQHVGERRAWIIEALAVQCTATHIVETS
jgi:hypothetical protein